MALNNSIASRLMSDLQKDFGLTKDQAAGVVGNLAHESGGFNSLQELKPLVPGSRGGYGYAQWTGPRRRNFEKFSADKGFKPESYEANYGFLKHEIETDPYERGQFLKVKKAKTAKDAAKIVSENFLRPGIPHMDSRVRYADQFSRQEFEPQTAAAALDQFAPQPQSAPNRTAFAPEEPQRAPAITPIPDPSSAYGTRNAPTPRRDPRSAPQAIEEPQVDYMQAAKDSVREQLLQMRNEEPKADETGSFANLFEQDDTPFNTEAGVYPLPVDRPASVPNQAPGFQAIKPPTQQASTFQNINPKPKMDGIGKGVNFADFMAAMGPKPNAPQATAPRRVMGLAPVQFTPQVRVQQAPQVAPQPARQNIDPNNHNQAALQAIRQGRGSYVNSSGSVMPTRAPSGKLRNTYGD